MVPIRVFWSPEQCALGLPSIQRTTDSARLATTPPADGAWSLVIQFSAPPSEQGSPSLAEASWLFPDAPAEWLQPGQELRLFERGTQLEARIEVLPKN